MVTKSGVEMVELPRWTNGRGVTDIEGGGCALDVLVLAIHAPPFLYLLDQVFEPMLELIVPGHALPHLHGGQLRMQTFTISIHIACTHIQRVTGFGRLTPQGAKTTSGLPKTAVRRLHSPRRDRRSPRQCGWCLGGQALKLPEKRAPRTGK